MLDFWIPINMSWQVHDILVESQVTWAGARRWWKEAASRAGPETVQNVEND
jgi:hypothetical protein